MNAEERAFVVFYVSAGAALLALVMAMAVLALLLA